MLLIFEHRYCNSLTSTTSKGAKVEKRSRMIKERPKLEIERARQVGNVEKLDEEPEERKVSSFEEKLSLQKEAITDWATSPGAVRQGLRSSRKCENQN